MSTEDESAGATLLISGYREFSDSKVIERVFDKVNFDHGPFTTIVHGGCRGVDMTMDRIARDLGLEVKIFVVTGEEWRRLGTRAGPLRNRRMLEQNPDHVLLFLHADSKGTADTHRLCRQRKIDHTVYQIETDSGESVIYPVNDI